MRQKEIKLQYLRPQTEVVAADYQQFIATSFEGGHEQGDLEEIGDAKKHDFEFSFKDVWAEWEK